MSGGIGTVLQHDLYRLASLEGRDDWRTADVIRDAAGSRINLRRGLLHLLMDISGIEARFGPISLRTLAAVLKGAADYIEREQAALPQDVNGDRPAPRRSGSS